MLKVATACLAAAMLCAGCIFDDEWYYDDEDCDCDEYLVQQPYHGSGDAPLRVRPRSE